MVLSKLPIMSLRQSQWPWLIWPRPWPQNYLALKCPSLTNWRYQNKTTSPPPAFDSWPQASHPQIACWLDNAPDPALTKPSPRFGVTSQALIQALPEPRRKPGGHVFAIMFSWMFFSFKSCSGIWHKALAKVNRKLLRKCIAYMYPTMFKKQI